jgi:hypothetical protein
VRRAWAPACLILLYWAIRYFHLPAFGLYEDDFTHFPTVFGMSWGDVLRYAADPARIVALREQGHPLHNSFIYLLSAVGWRLSGLRGAYWAGFAVQSLNIVLFYSLLRRIHRSALAILGTLVYVVYAADTTQSFLTYALGLHPSMTFLLLALHAYLSSWTVLAYGLASLTLLTYETTYLVFLAAPLLAPERSFRTRHHWLVHLAVSLGILAVFIFVRVCIGDDRVLGLQGWEQIVRPAVNAIVGPAVSLGTFVYRPYQALVSGNVEAWAAAAVVGVALYLLFTRLPLGMTSAVEPVPKSPSSGAPDAGWRVRLSGRWAAVPQDVKHLLRIALAGGLMTVLAYPLMLTVRPYALNGRDTRVHAAAVVGIAMLLGALLMIVLWLGARSRKRHWIAILLAAWMGWMAGYGLVIQNDYILAWQAQKHFWRELLPLIPDVGEGEAVLVDPHALQDTRQIGANYWNLPVVLEQLFEFPDDWERPPRVFRLSENWRSSIMRSADTASLNEASTYASPSTYYNLHMKDTILIVARNGRLVRLVGPVLLEREQEWAPPSGMPVEPPYPPALLYGLMLGRPSGSLGD